MKDDRMRTWTDDHHKGDKAENDDRHKDDQKDDWFKLNVLDKVREKERQKVLAEVDAVLDEYIDLNKKMPTVRKDWEGISKACTAQLKQLKEEIKSRLEPFEAGKGSSKTKATEGGNKVLKMKDDWVDGYTEGFASAMESNVKVIDEEFDKNIKGWTNAFEKGFKEGRAKTLAEVSKLVEELSNIYQAGLTCKGMTIDERHIMERVVINLKELLTKIREPFEAGKGSSKTKATEGK